MGEWGDYSAAVSRYCLIALAASSWVFCNTSLTMQASKLGACESSNSARLMRCWMTSCESVPRFSSRWRRASIEGGFMKRLNARPPYIFLCFARRRRQCRRPHYRRLPAVCRPQCGAFRNSGFHRLPHIPESRPLKFVGGNLLA